MVLTHKISGGIFNSTLLVPAFTGAKVSDAVFICNPDTDYVEYECSVKSIKGNLLELRPIHFAEEHPWLSIDALVENDILTPEFAEARAEALTKTAVVQLKTIFASPERYK